MVASISRRVKSLPSIFLLATLVLSLFTTILQPILANTLITPAGSTLPTPGDYWDFPFTGTIQSQTLPVCTFRLQVWGAQGGLGSGGGTFQGGRGGYSEAALTVTTPTEVFIVVGGQGSSGSSTIRNTPIAGGFNGGGTGRTSQSGQNVGGGGGATHISLATGLLTENSVRDEILIVAGAGGGSGVNAGAGDAGMPGSTSSTNAVGGGAGTQIAGGTGGTAPAPRPAGLPGAEGMGGSGGGNSVQSGSGGGGGGWFGGGGGGSGAPNSGAGGGGGSGFISPTLASSQIIAGNQSMPNPLGGTMIGNTGNGFARITVIECPDPYEILSIRAEVNPSEVTINSPNPTITVWGTARNGTERILSSTEFNLSSPLSTATLGNHTITITHTNFDTNSPNNDLITTIAYTVIPAPINNNPNIPEAPNSGAVGRGL